MLGKSQDELAHRIGAYLEHRIPGCRDVAVEGLRRLPIGSSKENIAFTARWQEEGQAKRRRFLMRRELSAGVLEASAETEYRLMGALRGTGVPVPRVYWLETDPKWLDRPFFVEEFVRGESSWAKLARSPAEERDAVIRQLVGILAIQHQLDWKSLGLNFLGVPSDAEDCADRLIAHWADVLRRHRLGPQPLLGSLIQWLRIHRAQTVNHIALVHGDPGPGNFLYRNGRIVAVVDWEMAHLGDPMDDVAWLCFRLETTGLFLERDELLGLYSELSGIPVDPVSVRYYEVFANVRAAIACLSGLHAFCHGSNLDLNMAYVGIVVQRWCLLQATRLIATA